MVGLGGEKREGEGLTRRCCVEDVVVMYFFVSYFVSFNIFLRLNFKKKKKKAPQSLVETADYNVVVAGETQRVLR